MKTKAILFSSLALFITIATACNSGGSNQSSAESAGSEQETQAVESGNPQFKDEKSGAVYQHYIHLKAALVESDFKEAQSGAGKLQSALTNAGNSKGADIAGKIASATDIAGQRSNFDQLTAEVESFVRSAGLKSGKIYKQYCPMARDGEGAYWLASETEIKNPYYGDEMLNCGEVKEEIK